MAYALDKDGNRVERGNTVENFRGESWEFVKVSREPDPGGPSTGRVAVQRPCKHKEEPYWCNGTEYRELFPSVFDLEIRTD